MERRQLLRSLGVATTAGIAGCSSENSNPKNASESTASTPTEDGASSSDEDLPHPDDRNYDLIHGNHVNEEFPQVFTSNLDHAEEEIDRLIFNSDESGMANEVERDLYNIEVSNVGEDTVDVGGEEYNANLVSLEISPEVDGDISSNSARDSITAIMENIVPEGEQDDGIAYTRLHGHAISGRSTNYLISDISISVGNDSGTGRVNYSSRDLDGYTDLTELGDSWQAYFEGDDNAIEAQVEEDFTFTE